jgi:APA family basic amino acid/polyamine antiporter
VSEPGPGRIQARLGAFDTAMVVVSLVVGIGIFRTPALVAASSGSAHAFYAAWALGGVVSLMGALTYAEIGARLPRAGGYYRVVAECYHPRLAFMLNWSQAVLQGAGAAGVAFIGAEYLDLVLLPTDRRGPGAVLATACALMLALLALNWLGIRAGARAQNLLSLAKIVMIVGLALAAFLLAAPATASGSAPAAASTAGAAAGFASAVVAVFYTYGGYQNAMNLGNDVRDAPRNLPRAVTGGMLIVLALYLLLNLAYERVLGFDGVAAAPLVAAALARAAFGAAGETVVSLAIFLSAAGFVNATILQMPRSYYAMAEDGALPAAFLRVDARTQVQRTGLAFFGLTMLGPAFLLGSFEQLLSYVMFSDALALATVASTIFVLRRRRVGGPGFRMPGYPVLPALFALCLLGVAARVAVTEPRLALAGLVILLVGAPLFSLARRASGAGASGS